MIVIGCNCSLRRHWQLVSELAINDDDRLLLHVRHLLTLLLCELARAANRVQSAPLASQAAHAGQINLAITTRLTSSYPLECVSNKVITLHAAAHHSLLLLLLLRPFKFLDGSGAEDLLRGTLRQGDHRCGGRCLLLCLALV